MKRPESAIRSGRVVKKSTWLGQNVMINKVVNREKVEEVQKKRQTFQS